MNQEIAHYAFVEEIQRRLRKAEAFSYPNPHDVVAAALEQIQSDRSVHLIYRGEDVRDMEAEAVVYEGMDPIDVTNLPDMLYKPQLVALTNAIAHSIVAIGQAIVESEEDAHKVDFEIKLLAHTLTAYRHEPRFIQHALSKLEISPDGQLQRHQLPVDWLPTIALERQVYGTMPQTSR